MNMYRGKHVDKRLFIEKYPEMVQISDKECFRKIKFSKTTLLVAQRLFDSMT